MGLLKIIGTIAGTAIGSFFGAPQVGAAVGKAAGGIGEKALKKKPSAGAGGSTEYIQQQPKISLDDIRSKSSAMEILAKRSNDVKVAQTAQIPKIDATGKSMVMEDPWQPARNWWADLGGEPSRFGPIDDTRMP